MIDLHLHLDGSLSTKTMLELAKKDNIQLPTYNIDELQKYLSVPVDCESLNDYLKCFDLPLSVLQTKESITTAVYNLLEELKAQGLIYAEIRFAPQLHMKKGLSQEEVVEAAVNGLKKSTLKANLILCCMRGEANHKENFDTINVAKKYLNNGVCAVDLAGAEALYKTSSFAKEFELARELNIPFTIHAGEADGPQSVKTALEFGAKRIGHGIHSIEDKDVLQQIINNKIPLEMCPTSNFQTKTAKSIQEYPFRKFLDAGVIVTINTDNTTVSNTTIAKEFEFLKKHYNLTENEKIKLLNNSIDVAFISNEEKNQLREILNKKTNN